MIMDAQDIIELIEYFRNLQDTEMKFEIGGKGGEN